MLKKISIGLCLVVTALLASDLQAQETKIGYVNPQAILNRMPEMKAIQQRIKNTEDRQLAKLASEEAAIEQAFLEYEQKKDVISAAAKKTNEDMIRKMQEDFQKSQNEANTAVQQKRNELLGPVQQQISQAIDAVAKRMELSYVLNTITSTGDMVILYASEEYAVKYNITDAVMVELGI